VEVSLIWLPGGYFLCVAGVKLSSLIIKEMMKLYGTLVSGYASFLKESQSGPEISNNQITSGIDSWFMRTGGRLENKLKMHWRIAIGKVTGLSL